MQSLTNGMDWVEAEMRPLKNVLPEPLFNLLSYYVSCGKRSKASHLVALVVAFASTKRAELDADHVLDSIKELRLRTDPHPAKERGRLAALDDVAQLVRLLR